MMRVLRIASIALLVYLLPAVARAQSCTTATISPPSTCSLSLSQTTGTMVIGTTTSLTLSSTTTTIPAPTSSDYDLGYQSGTGPTLTVKSNAPWTLKVASSTAVWSAVSAIGQPAARANKPSTDLLLFTTGMGGYTGVTTTGFTLTGSRTSSTAFVMSYRVNWSYTLDTPGQYTLNVVYTLSAP